MHWQSQYNTLAIQNTCRSRLSQNSGALPPSTRNARSSTILVDYGCPTLLITHTLTTCYYTILRLQLQIQNTEIRSDPCRFLPSTFGGQTSAVFRVTSQLPSQQIGSLPVCSLLSSAATRFYEVQSREYESDAMQA